MSILIASFESEAHAGATIVNLPPHPEAVKTLFVLFALRVLK